MMVGMTDLRPPPPPHCPPPRVPSPVRDTSVAAVVLTVVVALLLLPIMMLGVAVGLGVVWGAPALVVLVATFAGAPVIVALMIPEIYRWLRRTL